MSIAGLLERLEFVHDCKPENVYTDCDMSIKTRSLPGITLPESSNIQFSMNQFSLQIVVTQSLFGTIYIFA